MDFCECWSSWCRDAVLFYPRGSTSPDAANSCCLQLVFILFFLGHSCPNCGRASDSSLFGSNIVRATRADLHLFRVTFDKQFTLPLCCVGFVQKQSNPLIVWIWQVLRPGLNIRFDDCIAVLFFSIISDAKLFCVLWRPSQHSLTAFVYYSFFGFPVQLLIQLIGHPTNIYSMSPPLHFSLRTGVTLLHFISHTTFFLAFTTQNFHSRCT